MLFVMKGKALVLVDGRKNWHEILPKWKKTQQQIQKTMSKSTMKYQKWQQQKK